MEKNRKKQIKGILCWCAIGCLVVALAVMPLAAAKNAEDAAPKAAIRCEQAAYGTLEQGLRFGGTLAAETAVEVSLPSGIKLTEFLVKNGDSVRKGDALAAVDPVSVMTAIVNIQETLEYLDSQINDVDTDSATTRLTAQTAGRVKAVYAREGDSVRQVMLSYGALAVLSLDGRMAVDVETDQVLRVGDSVTVALETGEECAGRVDSRLGNTLIVTMEDGGYEVDTQASVLTPDGQILGRGKLYIHNPWRVTAVSGTVSDVQVAENDRVTKGKTLLTLSDTDTATQQKVLLGQRQDYEETMEQLFRMYRSGVLEAPCDGLVEGIQEDSPWLLRGEEGWVVQLLTNQEPGELPQESEPEQPQPEPVTYTGVVALVTQGEDGLLQFLTNGQEVTISDASQLTPEQKDPAAMTIPYAYTGNLYLYVISQGELLLTATPAGAGQLVLIQEDRLISLGTVSAGSAGNGENSSGQLPDSGAAMMPGGMAGGEMAPSFEPYDLTQTKVLTVTPVETMTLEVPVDELDIGRISLGMEAQVTVTALADQRVSARVTKIGTASNSGGNSKFAVTLTLDREENMLPGMSASAVLPWGTAENVLTIPAGALQDDGRETFVYTAYDKKTGTLSAPVTVTTGLSDGERVEILSGLEDGQWVYYRYYEG